MNTSKVSGIYAIKHVETNQIYIGKSIDIYSRWKTHKKELANNKHHNPKLQKVANEYGVDSLIFKIIHKANEHELGLLELRYIMQVFELGYAMNVVGHKDFLRYKLVEALENLDFDNLRIDVKHEDCVSAKGNPLNWAVYATMYDQEVFINIYNSDYTGDDENSLNRLIFSNKDRFVYEIGFSSADGFNCSGAVKRIIKDIKFDLSI